MMGKCITFSNISARSSAATIVSKRSFCTDQVWKISTYSKQSFQWKTWRIMVFSKGTKHYKRLDLYCMPPCLCSRRIWHVHIQLILVGIIISTPTTYIMQHFQQFQENCNSSLNMMAAGQLMVIKCILNPVQIGIWVNVDAAFWDSRNFNSLILQSQREVYILSPQKTCLMTESVSQHLPLGVQWKPAPQNRFVADS